MKEGDTGQWAQLLDRQPREAQKVKEMDSSLRVTRRNQPCGHLTFTPVGFISDFWPPEL